MTDLERAPHPRTALPYRPDVDGLRALAVLAIITFHASPAALPGGFAGVDVFFVISGFLITGILLEPRGVRPGWATFYGRRVRRLFPALAVVLAATLALGWHLMLPLEFRQLSRHAAATGTFVVNGAFWREAGYFDLAGEFKPLLHAWSLAVEEQFYLLWPLVLVAGSQSMLTLRPAIAALMTVSFVLGLWWVARDGAGAFFLLPGRLWELAGGGLLACVPPPRRMRAADNVLALAGLALLAVAFVALRGTRHYPGGWALLPVLGTVALIRAGPHAIPNARLLSNRALVFVGLVSYPLYLWHWPALAFTRIVAGGDPGWTAIGAAIAVAAVLAVATYAWIERPIRRAGRRATAWLAIAMAGVVAFALAGATGLLPPRASDPVLASFEAAQHDWAFPGPLLREEVVGKGLPVRAAGRGRTVLVIGDSNAQQYAPRVTALLEGGLSGARVAFATAGSCPPMRGVEYRARTGCPALAARALDHAASPEVDGVVLAAQWSAYLDPATIAYVGADGRVLTGAEAVDAALAGFSSTIASLRALGKTVHVVLNIPVGDAFDPRHLLQRDWHGNFTVHGDGVPRDAWERAVAPTAGPLADAARLAGAIVVDPAQTLCASGTCPARAADGSPLYRDGFHLRASFVAHEVRYLDEALGGVR